MIGKAHMRISFVCVKLITYTFPMTINQKMLFELTSFTYEKTNFAGQLFLAKCRNF